MITDTMFRSFGNVGENNCFPPFTLASCSSLPLSPPPSSPPPPLSDDLSSIHHLAVLLLLLQAALSLLLQAALSLPLPAATTLLLPHPLPPPCGRLRPPTTRLHLPTTALPSFVHLAAPFSSPVFLLCRLRPPMTPLPFTALPPSILAPLPSSLPHSFFTSPPLPSLLSAAFAHQRPLSSPSPHRLHLPLPPPHPSPPLFLILPQVPRVQPLLEAFIPSCCHRLLNVRIVSVTHCDLKDSAALPCRQRVSAGGSMLSAAVRMKDGEDQDGNGEG